MTDPKTTRQHQEGGPGAKMYQAGGNIIINEAPDRSGVMHKLVQLYWAEKNKPGDNEFKGYIRKLEKYITNIDGPEQNLEIKLNDAGYSCDVDWALSLKEEYAKLLRENAFSQATQHIHAYLLAWTIVLFNQFVLESIRAGNSHELVKQAMVEKVIVSVENALGGENNVLELYSDDITGMIYYLTGNCHIKWK